MKNILFVTNESCHGGAERMLIWVANQLSRSGKYNVIFCNLKNEPAYYPLDDSIKFVCKEKDTSDNFIYRNTIGLLSKTSYIKKVIKDNKVDAVVNFNDHALYNIIMCRLGAKFKLIVSQRVDPASIVSKTGKFRLKLLKYADGLVCQTQSALDFFDEKIKKVSTVINNPVYNIPERSWNEDNTENCIINIARIELKQKRQDVLIKAFKKVCEKNNEVKLKIFGAAIEEDLAEMNSLIRSLGLNDRIEYCGVTNDVAGEMRKSKIFVLSSDYEGIPNSVIEAMALGMPIISTDCKPGGARMLLEDGSGVLVPIGDSEKLAEEIELMLDDREKAKKYGEKARISVRRFDENKIGAEWIDFFEKIV